jgi:hypothetical protein
MYYDIANTATTCHGNDMSFAELKEQVRMLSAEQRLELAHLLAIINLENDPEFLKEMDRRLDEMAAGKKVTQEEVERIHQELLAQGR